MANFITGKASAHLNAVQAYRNSAGIKPVASGAQEQSFANVLDQISSISDKAKNITVSNGAYNSVYGAANNSSAMTGIIGSSLTKAQNKIRRSETVTGKALIKESSLADLTFAINEAEIILQTIITVRDKALAAYQDIIKMSI